MRAPGRFGLTILLVSLGIAAVLALVGEEAEALYVSGDWIVDTDLAYDGEDITVRGNIQIQDGGSLTLHNLTLEIDSRRGDRFRFRVEDTGNLYAYDTVIKTRTEANNDERYFFDVLNNSVLVNCDISRLYGWNNDNPGGIRLLGGSHIIEGCTIHDSRTYGVYARCPLVMKDTTIRSTGWSRLAILTAGVLVDMDFYISNCTFIGNVNDPYSYGIYAGDSYSGQHWRYLNATFCNFEGLSYGVYANADWGNGVIELTYNEYDRCSYGVRAYTNAMDIYMHHNHYYVRSGGYGIRLFQGSFGNCTWRHEDIRATSEGSGYGCYLEGPSTCRHLVKDNTIWHTYYGIILTYGHCTVIDSVVNTTNNNFYVYNGAVIEIFATKHQVGSGFVDTTGGTITAWQRLNVSSVKWSNDAPITTGTLYILNATDHLVGEMDLTQAPRHLDFKRWEVKRLWKWENTRVFPAIKDVDTWFRAAELDYLEDSPQDIVFVDDYVPRLTMPGIEDGHAVNVSYLILDGGVVERGQGLLSVQVSLDGESWQTATVTGDMWDFAYTRVPEGRYDLHVRATDKAGNTETLVRRDVIVDTMPPPITLLNEVPSATNQPLLRLEGVTERGAEVYVGLVMGFPEENGSFVIDYPLEEGVNGLVIRVRDVAGNWNQSVHSIVLDTRPPVLAIRRPADGMVTKDTVVPVAGSTDEGVTVTVDGEEVTTYKGAFSVDLDLEEGEHDIVIEAVDQAGNTALVVRTVVVDLTPPVLVIDRPSGPVHTTTDGTAYIAGRTDEEIDHVFINGQNMTALPGEFAIQVTLAEGDNPFTLKVRDRAGNENSVIVTIVRDTRPPNYSIDEEAKDGEITVSGTIKYTTSDTLVFHVQVDEHAYFTIGSVTHDGEGQFSFEHGLVEGSNNIHIEVADGLGNLADPWVYVVTRDTTAPVVSFTFPSDGSSTTKGEVTIRGVCDDPAAKVWINDIPVGLSNDGTFDLVVALDMGDNTYAAKCRDKAGNEGTSSLTVELREEETVQESDVSGIALGLVIGLVVGILVMYMMGRRSALEGEEGRGPPMPPGRTPPPPPPEPPTDGDRRTGPGWEEY